MIDLTARRLRYRAPLRPALGSRFQPTGFPDLGPAEFLSHDGTEQVRSLLVESAGSMANRLEATTWDPAAQAPVALIADLPHVEVRNATSPDVFLTSSRLEAHRLASAFVRDSHLNGELMTEVIRQRLGLANDQPLHYPTLAAAVFALDPLALLHGCFFNQKTWYGQPRFTRAIGGEIEAHGVEQAVSGGRKADHVRHSVNDQAPTGEDEYALGGSSEGYGSIPFSRIEYTARTIEAQFSIDVQLLRSYNLGPARTELLTALALWQIRTFLDDGLRLRTACDLEPVGAIQGTTPLPDADQLAERIHQLMPAALTDLDHTGPLTVLWNGGKTKKSKKSEKTTKSSKAGKNTVPSQGGSQETLESAAAADGAPR